MPRRFDVAGTKFFFTYPECPVTKDECLAQLGRKLQIFHYIVASELHANGHQHLHVYVELLEHKRFQDSRFADLLLDSVVYHGNYQGCRSVKNVMQYVTKGADYISDLQVQALLLGKRVNRTDLCDALIKKTKTLEDAIVETPSLLYDYTKLDRSLTLFKVRTAVKQDVPDFLPNGFDPPLLLPYNLPCKQRHYWIYSREPNRGKSYLFAKPLADLYGFEFGGPDFTYWNVTPYTNGIILDDYNYARIKYADLNLLCDGSFNFRLINHGFIKIKNYIVVVCSNVPISEVYPNAYNLLQERFIEICVDKQP